MKGRSPYFTQLPLDIVGSTKFGRYPKISQEQTWNMIISDNFLVDYAGYMKVATILPQGRGRGIFTSTRTNQMIAVIDNNVYSISPSIDFELIGSIDTFSGDVFIDENQISQIAICDKTNIWIYDYNANTFKKAFTSPSSTALDFIPGYISFHNGRFIAAAFDPVTNTWSWRLSLITDGHSFPNDSAHVGLLQSKPDKVIAAQRFPGRSNLIFVFGSTVTELWQDIGANLFPYQRNSSVNIDYGCLNPATIAYNENIMVWLAANEKSGPVIAYSTGGDIKRISTDGIDFKFTQLTNPSNSYGFLFRQDGHLIYQITFPDDQLTYIYDFNTDKFFNASDEKQNAHIAKRVSFFNNSYYFVSFIDGNVYQMSTQFTTYNGNIVPRIRITKPVRMPDASRFVINNLTFTIEEGTQPDVFFGDDLLTEDFKIIQTENLQDIEVSASLIVFEDEPLETETDLDLLTEDNQIIYAVIADDTPQPVPQTVDLSISKNGGMSFGSTWNKQLNRSGYYQNRLIFWNLGSANDFTAQLRFNGVGRYVVTDGILSVYQ